MLRTEQPSSYFRDRDYYKLWLDKKRENCKLQNSLLDSKRVIRTLHLKLTEILKSIKIFETSQELTNSEQEEETDVTIVTFEQVDNPVTACNEATYQSVPANNVVTALGVNVNGRISELLESRRELDNANFDEQMQPENAITSDIQPFSTLPDSLHLVSKLNPVETRNRKRETIRRKQHRCNIQKEIHSTSADIQEKDTTFSSAAVDKSIIDLEEKVKGHPDDLQENRIEQAEENGNQDRLTENIGSFPVILPFQKLSDSSYCNLTFEVEDSNPTSTRRLSTSNNDMPVCANVQTEDSNNATYAFVPASEQIISSDFVVKAEPCVAPEIKSELVEVNCDPEVLTECASSSTENQPFLTLPDFLYSDLTFETHDENQLEVQEKQKEVSKDNLLTPDLQDVSVGGELLQECSYCHKKFKTTVDFSKQPKRDTIAPLCITCQNKASYLAKIKSKYVCEICGKMFTDSQALASHSSCHKNDNLHTLDKTSAIENVLSGHKGSDINLHGCEVIVDRLDLNLNPHSKAHQPRHPSSKPYECEVCHKKFFTSVYLVSHLRTHTKEKPFECEMCEQKFTLERALKRHQIQHSGLKPHKCSICGRGFSRYYELNRHHKSHTGEKPFQCDFCLKRFSRPAYLKDHLHIHTGEKPYQCECCGKTFSCLRSKQRCNHSLT